MSYKSHCHKSHSRINPTARRFLLAPLLLVSLLLAFTSASIAAAGQLHIQVIDDTGKPVVNVVAALIPIPVINYNAQPSAIMDQRNNMFVPGVLAVRVNTLVNFPNSDDVRHHVYSFSPAKKFELRLYHGMTAKPVLFDQAGKVVLGCNIHDSMVGYIYVVNSDYFAVADNNGLITIDKLPAGDYQLEIYHPKLSSDYPVEKIRIADQQAIDKKITLLGLTLPDTNKAADEFSELFQ